MFKNLNFPKLIESKYLFYFVLLINLVLLCLTRFYPSMDGPAHLYNSNLLFKLLTGNESLSEYYSINSLPVPNYSSHFILAVFGSFLPGWLAEKMLLIIYVSGMALSFRYLVKVLNPQNNYLSLLIFPFIYSFLFHLGFYNFSISFILLFTTLGYWLRNRDTGAFSNYFLLVVLFLLAYFSNVLIFGFLGLTIGFYIVYFSFIHFWQNKNIAEAIRFGSKKLAMLLIVSLPGLILLFVFYTNVNFFPSDQSYPAKELIKWINDARPFIVYDYVGEEIVTEQLFHILLILIVLSYIPKKNRDESGRTFIINASSVIVIPLLLSLALLFITPSGSGAGMMSDRYCLLVYIFGLIWIIARTVHFKINYYLTVIVLLLHFGLLLKHINGSIRELDADAGTINQVENYIEENSVVLPVNLSDSWLEPHFSNYMGADKPMVILENYEASVGWFPVKWNANLPNTFLAGKNSVSGIQWPSNPDSKKTKQIDYVLLYGNTGKLDDANWSELKEILALNFKLKYRSDNNFVFLYKSLQ